MDLELALFYTEPILGRGFLMKKISKPLAKKQAIQLTFFFQFLANAGVAQR
ncbi:unknown protein [Waddlia chondrophila 2032/99]|uniref:Uncharacterized protein n=1 Tax=Waddlia chondrophila 2032/99 TaxID=765953 RepID=F8LEZ3_9BACT|nr:unknown protein [Waddlia chondrophila 2032/99]